MIERRYYTQDQITSNPLPLASSPIVTTAAVKPFCEIHKLLQNGFWGLVMAQNCTKLEFSGVVVFVKKLQKFVIAVSQCMKLKVKVLGASPTPTLSVLNVKLR
jgi:hypothetical protein